MIYLDLSRIIRRFRFKRLILFFFHLFLILAVVKCKATQRGNIWRIYTFCIASFVLFLCSANKTMAPVFPHCIIHTDLCFFFLDGPRRWERGGHPAAKRYTALSLYTYYSSHPDSLYPICFIYPW